LEELGPGNRDFFGPCELASRRYASAIWGQKKFHYLIYKIIYVPARKLSPKDTKTPQTISLVSLMASDIVVETHMLTPGNSLIEMQYQEQSGSGFMIKPTLKNAVTLYH
jgi:hypothetical protein